MTGIYGIYNTDTGKWYVGQAVDLAKRFRQHKAMLRAGKHRNRHLQSAYNQSGPNSFSFNVLEVCAVEELNSKEMYWVEVKDALRNGYNNTAGGDGVLRLKMTVETRAKMSAAHLGSTRTEDQKARISAAHKHSAAVAEHLSRVHEAKKMREVTEKERKHLKQLNAKQKKAVLCIETEQRFESAHDAARAFNTYQSNISLCCRNSSRTHKGFHWKYIE